MAAVSLNGCALRRQRLVESLVHSGLDAAVVSDVRDCFYFTGTLLPNDLPAVLFMPVDGAASMVVPDGYDVPGVDRVDSYAWNHRGTRHPDALERLAAALDRVRPDFAGKRVGFQHESIALRIARAMENAGARELVAIDAPIAAMQRRKDPDELAVIRESIQANLGAYAEVSEAIAAGVSELDVLAAGRRGAARAAREKVFHDGDYQCGTYNGPARNRVVERGELYIVDAWTCYRGYWSDMSRTFVVGAPPSDVQQALFDHIRWVQAQVPSLLRPGVDGTEVFRALDELIRQYPPLTDAGLIHHGGHAIGLRSHEMPDINLERGGALEAGNILCIEPGGYFAAARSGVRLENMYLITESGCEDLCPGEIVLNRCG